MPNASAIRIYCRQVRRNLQLPRKQKKCLLDGLYQELAEHFSSTEGLTLEMIYKEIGHPKFSARSLMECADENQLAQYQFQKMLIAKIAAVAMTVIIILLIGLFIYAEDHQIDHAKTTITQYIEADA